jgi:hypothetical protein
MTMRLTPPVSLLAIHGLMPAITARKGKASFCSFVMVPEGALYPWV